MAATLDHDPRRIETHVGGRAPDGIGFTAERSEV